MEVARHTSQKAPAGLAGVLNGPEEHRDSAYFSSADTTSKHNSAASCLGVGVLSPTGSNFNMSPSDNTPSPTSSHPAHQTLVSPANSHMSVAAMVSPTTPGGPDPRPRVDRLRSIDSGHSSVTFGGHADIPEAMSRRESVDSRMNQGFNEMRLGSSPYASHNPSTTSIQSTLQQQRNPRPSYDTLAVHRISNGYQPSAERNPDGFAKNIRTAPAITGPAISQIARAAEPTKGQAWAFPEEEIHRLPSRESLIDSRRSSVADSLASSQFTTESRLPPGQRRLDDSLSPIDYRHRLSNASGEFPAVHHHTLQHKQIGDLQGEESPHAGSQPYSRTPELRVSHKLAERKRRTEMKELFEQLRDLMPQERGSKASKWEILTKAIAEHQRQSDLIKYWQSQATTLHTEADHLRRELQTIRMENQQLRGDLITGQQQQRMSSQSSMAPDTYVAPDQFRPAPSRPELPPLRSLQNGGPGGPNPDTMTGVQYDQPRAGYHPGEPQRY